MSKEFKHRRDDRKKPQLTLKERRAKKQEKRQQKWDQTHRVVEELPPTE